MKTTAGRALQHFLEGGKMKTHDENGVINPEFVRTASRADDLLSEALLALRNGHYIVADDKLKDAAKWLADLADADPT